MLLGRGLCDELITHSPHWAAQPEEIINFSLNVTITIIIALTADVRLTIYLRLLESTLNNKNNDDDDNDDDNNNNNIVSSLVPHHEY
jgi:hypothetical protein